MYVYCTYSFSCRKDCCMVFFLFRNKLDDIAGELLVNCRLLRIPIFKLLPEGNLEEKKLWSL